MTPGGHPACVRRRIPLKSSPVPSSRALFRSLLLAGALGLVLLPGRPASAALAATPAANANPASQSLLSRLPDPSEFKKNPLENVAKGQDPIVNDKTFKDLQAASKRHDPKTVFKDLRDLTTRYPNKYSGLHELRGFLALHYHLFGEAENSFRQVTRIEPHAPTGWYSLSFAELLQGRVPAAEADARASVKASDSFAAGWILLAGCQAKLGKKVDATASATHATQVAPNKALTWISLAQCKIQQGKQGRRHRRPGARAQHREHSARQRVARFVLRPAQPARQGRFSLPAGAPGQAGRRGHLPSARLLLPRHRQRGGGGTGLPPGHQGPAGQRRRLGTCSVCVTGARASSARQSMPSSTPSRTRRRDLSAREHLDEARLGPAAPRLRAFPVACKGVRRLAGGCLCQRLFFGPARAGGRRRGCRRGHPAPDRRRVLR